MHIIAGRFRSRLLISPKGEITKPTTGRLREAVFNICQNSIEDSEFLDLFAGSGAMGLEAISRGARKSIFVDNNREAIRCLNRNIETLGIQEQTLVLFGDVLARLKALEGKNAQFDIIYADPPYGLLATETITYGEKIVRLIDEGSLLKPGGTLFIEESLVAAPQVFQLKTLLLKKSREFGHSILQQYEKRVE